MDATKKKLTKVQWGFILNISITDSDIYTENLIYSEDISSVYFYILFL